MSNKANAVRPGNSELQRKQVVLDLIERRRDGLLPTSPSHREDIATALTPPPSRRRDLDELLDAALEETFPASDPVAITVDR